ncbi:MAG: VOC family protein [Methanobacteriota archaeon]|nr:MAG: VOC family protein [Euryarchaeota archaeon]
MTRKRKVAEPRAERVPMFTELASTDPATTRSFLEKVFGWSFASTKMPMGEYLSYRTPTGGQGGVRPTRGTEAPTSMSYVRVPDLDAALQKIRRAGGDIVLPRVDVPGMGSFFWFRIPSGPMMACWQDAPSLPEEESR